jgi:microcin C transport system substrate-binding protein
MRRFCLLLALSVLAAPAAAQQGEVAHALSLFDDIKYPADFPHFEYVNPDAPKGGRVTLAAMGTFDTLNPFVIKGTPAAGSGAIYDTLLASSMDEPSTSYGLIAETVEVPEDRSWVIFNLRPQARFRDGQPVTAEDVAFSFNVLKELGAPVYRYYYANVEPPEVLGPHRIRFKFSGGLNRELPLILGQLPVLPKHYWDGKDFAATTLEPPLGSGPYAIGRVDPGRSIELDLVEGYWARDLPVQRGQNNFSLRYEYFRDTTVMVEAFKGHQYDYRAENSARNWATAYEQFPALERGLVIKELLPDENPIGMQAFVLNLRRPKFQDERVRRAIGLTFDFEWSNKNLFYGQYARIDSFFDGSELAAEGLPGPLELEYLEPLRDNVPPQVFTKAYQPPKTDGSGNIRDHLRQAFELLKDAGYEVKGGVLRNAAGAPLTVEFLIVQADFERVIAPMVRNLKRLGIQADIRLVDVSQYRERLDNYDFDVITSGWGQSLSPGNEQREYWGSAAADRPGSRNLAGIKDEAIDILIENIVNAEDRAHLVAATRALDRVLLWHHYVIPQFGLAADRIIYWNRFGRPDVKPKYNVGFPSTWWIDADKDAVLRAAGVK